MKLLLTADGSHSLFSEQFTEVYHSRHGALQESQHVYIDCGLKGISLKEINILEIGFGTGLNALLSLVYSEDTQTKIHYTTFELYPVPSAMTERLNYPQLLSHQNASNYFSRLHTTPWGSSQQLTACFSLLKIQADVLTYTLAKDSYHLVYFDAFAPNHQAAMWTAAMFQKNFSAIKNGGILVTYCAKGDVQRAMKQAGFDIEKLPGPICKREILRASKK